MKLVKLLQPVLICIFISMLGCSTQVLTGAKKEMAPKPPADELKAGDNAALFILNLSGWTLIPHEQVILDNGQELVSLPRNTFVKFMVQPGSHEFGFPYRKEPTLNLDTVKGKTYYLQVTYKPQSSWAYAIEGDPIEIKQLTEGEAKSLLEKLEPLQMAAKKEIAPAPANEEQVSIKKSAPVTKMTEPPPPAAEGEMAPFPAVEKQVSTEKAAPMMKMNEPPQALVKEEKVPTSAAREMITDDSATLFIFNLSGWTMLPQDLTVLDNDKKLVSLPRKTYTKVEIIAGSHELGFQKRKESTLNLDALPGRVYYVSIAYKQQSSWVSPNATDPIEIKMLSEEEAGHLMNDLTLQ